MKKGNEETVNKSQAIRDALAAHPEKTPREIAEMLKSQGIDVSAQYVSVVKSTSKKDPSKEKAASAVRVRKRDKETAAAGTQKAGSAPVSVDSLSAAVTFITACGGLESAKKALSLVEQLRGAL
ncbi:MAG: hypothetical protein KatS3mg113_1030 [Planctomycetaceae bacterium]|nr:MAG: hypothetical protein KatS3mg113_1030 [Planctomycetaceae bacterium]